MSSSLCVAVVLTLLPAVIARRSGGGFGGGSSGGSGSIDDAKFDAPPLEIANLAVYSILLLATIILLLTVTPSLFHASTRVPAVGVISALIVGLAAYALGIAFVVVSFTFHPSGDLNVTQETLLRVQVPSNVLFYLRDPVIFTAIALVLQNRYRSVKKSSSAFIGFACTACFIFLAMIVFMAAYFGIYEATSLAWLNRDISIDETNSRLATSDHLDYTFVAFQVLGTIFLTASAFLVKARTKNDKIATSILFIVIPLLVLYSLARIIFVVLTTRLPFSDSYTAEVAYALDLSSTIVDGLLYIGMMGMLVFLLFRTRLWGAEPLAVQGAPPAHGAYQPQFYAQGTPPAQFPGQWGYPQQPQSGNQPQMYAYVPVQPTPSPGAQPLPNEKERISPSPAPHA